MGLISYIKNLHYNNRLNKACVLLSEKKYSEAEAIFTSLIDKHPLAAPKLAEAYLSLSPKNDAAKDISLFKKALGIKLPKEYDATSYNNVIAKYVAHIRERAVSCFDKELYKDSAALVLSLEEAKKASQEDIVLGAEARIRLILQCLKTEKVSGNSFSSLIESFKKEWELCSGQKRTEQYCLSFCQEMSRSKRYHVSNQLYAVILNDQYDVKCLDNAVHIVKGEDVEAPINTVSVTYCKRLVLREGVSLNESMSILDACWRNTSNDGIVMEVMQSVKDSALRDSFIDHILQNHKLYLTSSGLFKNFTKWLYDAFGGASSLRVLERIHTLGYDVEDYYSKKVHDWTSAMTCDAKLPHLNHAHNLFPNSQLIIDDKLYCAKKYLEGKENEKAISVLDTILDKSKEAILVKAQALCNLADAESDTDRKVDWLRQALIVQSSYKGSESSSIEARIIDSFIKSSSLYYSGGNREKAYSVLTDLAKKGYENAVFLIAKYRLSEIQAIDKIEDRGAAVASSIKELTAFNISSILGNGDYQSLWDEKISVAINGCRGSENASAISKLEKLLKEIESVGFAPEVVKDKRAQVVKQIVKRKYLIARERELADDFSQAATIYQQIVFLEAKRTPTLAALRFFLCKFKTSSSMVVLEHREQIYSLLRKASSALQAERDDIAYRFALILLKSGEDKEALSVLKEFLPQEEHLRKACEQGDMIKAIAKLEDFNEKIEAVKSKTLSSEDAVYFINHMLEYADTIKPILDIPRNRLREYRNKLKNYAIFKLFDEGRFDVAFEKMIKEHKDYLDDFTALRNIAIVCLNMAEAKQLTESNYKEVISVWLTSIYQEQLFIESLDYTSWDDQYTFSLCDAYGHFDEGTHDDLPDNVNYDDPNDSNVVSIREVQRILLDRFEASISDVQEYHVFYNSEKDAMDRFIALNLDEKCRIVAPFLSHKDDTVFQDIHDALEQDRQEGYENWEDVLYVGSLYQMPESIYEEYSSAKSYYEDCITTINTMNETGAAMVFKSATINLIRKYEKMSSALISYAKSKVSSLSSDSKNEFKRNYDFYLLICNAIKDDTLSFIFSNYVMQYVVGEVNSESMGKAAAANIIISIYLLDKNNGRVRDNLTTLFEMLVHENTPAASKAVAMLLDKLKNFDPITFQKLNNENEQAKIDKELNGIVDKVNKRTMSESDALGKVYDLYSINPQNSRLCENLAQLCEICIMKYIANQESGSMSVCRTLDKLKVNKSRTFNNHNGNLGAAYRKIWGQLPSDAKLTLMGLNPNATLNASGQALKKALDYFKALGGISETSSLRDILF